VAGGQRGGRAGFIAGASGDGWRIERDFGAFPVTLSGETATAEQWSTHLTVSPTPDRAWRFTNFGTNVNVAPAANDADPDGDGLWNELEYALGMDPNTASPSGRPVLALDAGGFLTLTFSRPVGVTDLTYRVEVSGDLTIWDTGSTYSATGDVLSNEFTTQLSRTTVNGVETIVVRDNQTTTAGRRFMRLKVTNP